MTSQGEAFIKGGAHKVGSLLKESLFSLLCSQKVLFPLPERTEALPSAQLRGRRGVGGWPWNPGAASGILLP